ncbi:MAG: hypothetical protein D6689_09350 [Deltaproteobacteria bacterium]|nr:MAG: hypothetical protein D6689_09350 [Deltaproteobacteria bacterium]
MSIRIVEIHPADDPKALNREWFVVENTGDRPFSTKNCALGTGYGGQRPKPLGTLDPGFVINPGEKVRVITGNPGRKAHGKPPEDDIPNYHLFLGAPVIKRPGVVLALTLRSAEVARATYDPNAAGGVAEA